MIAFSLPQNDCGQISCDIHIYAFSCQSFIYAYIHLYGSICCPSESKVFSQAIASAKHITSNQLVNTTYPCIYCISTDSMYGITLCQKSRIIRLLGIVKGKLAAGGGKLGTDLK